MKISVGSTNRTKITAVREAVILYPNIFADPEISALNVAVEQFGHPKNIKETIEGAMKRARKAFVDCEYSFGLEGGLMEMPLTKKGFMEVNVCAIYNGQDFYLGLSPAFEWPGKVTELILQGKADASKAFKDLGFTEHDKLGLQEGGVLGLLTDKRMMREDYMKYSIIMAMVRLDKKEFYSNV